MNGSLSSIYHNDTVSNAVDNVIECTNHLLTAHTLDELQPWLKIDLQAIYDVKKVIIYNRQDCCGDRLHDVQVNITNNGPEASCGFYEGPADDGDRIAVYCAFGAVGRYVLITILNPPEEKDPLNICEVQVFVDV
nr:fucolectin-like [Crassostrea gigas]